MMSRNTPGLIPEGGVIGKLPFDGQWLTERSPTRRVPSHGTHLFATTYAFDFVSVDDDGLTAPARSTPAPSTPDPPHPPGAESNPPRATVAQVLAAVLEDPSTVGKALPFIGGPTPIAQALASAPNSNKLR